MIQEGNIKYTIYIADLLVRQGEHRAALTMLLIAIAASSSKMFPPGTASIDNPAVKPGKINLMGDKEKFIRFLGPKLRIAMGFIDTQEDGKHDYLIEFSEKFPSPEEFIYKECRCPQIHEAGLPDSIRFIKNDKTDTSSFQIELNGSEGFFFHSGFLSLLRWAVVNAPTNGKEFGIHHFRPKSKLHDNIQEFNEYLSELINVTPGRIFMTMQELSTLINKNPEISYNNLKPMLISELEKKTNASFNLNSMGEPIITKGKITKTGTKLVDAIFNEIDFIDISS
ncbi:TPA: hypothetical protein ACHIDA_005674 [Raoultella ornithinolytica]|uniref:hypothetical protein n=1 Tax=Klebsiella variicola TaxID=244366 RepID=UPI001F420DD4|nr:hypothetical protein [Klebsiella variicola]MCF6969819.1 hypothetical protein [Klebsiella variicola]